ncbi:helix-turn-helix domain-containing protein [Aurantiacibacter sp. D1-12]|uniref:helix-turn-helix domain-containing protein n=1 Tax=Aurantiacibacter sp. D1-12 TaxID=2993658 RepID=UPI00237D2D12|nr:helix-turn-helix domain-containing protein [Aurantiacibacter sp. D1-12]MDE1467126.1 DUF4115 domain-containing protein [Aurantiacibacter sp. D1-12]
MSDDQNPQVEGDEQAVPEGVGPQLRAAREARGLSIEQVAAETRISARHIENIEEGAFHTLPGRTYAVGFAKTIAKVVGLDQEDVAAMVRAEMDIESPTERVAAPSTFEPGDPSRAPGGKLVWFSLFAVVLLLAGIFFASRVLFSPGAELPALTAEEGQAEGEAELADGSGSADDATPVDASGQVVFRAEGEVWVRFYDAQNRVLSEQTMQEGDTYAIPADAEGPRIITGRPDLLAITIGGRAVPKLSEEIETLDGAEISASALMARQAPPPVTESDTSVN